MNQTKMRKEILERLKQEKKALYPNAKSYDPRLQVDENELAQAMVDETRWLAQHPEAKETRGLVSVPIDTVLLERINALVDKRKLPRRTIVIDELLAKALELPYIKRPREKAIRCLTSLYLTPTQLNQITALSDASRSFVIENLLREALNHEN